MDRNLVKRILCVLASMLFLTVKLADIPIMSAGAVYPDGHGRLVYENEDGYYYFVDYYIVEADISGDVTIPSEIEGQPITEIIDYAFSKSEGLTSVVIPEGITKIGYGAFEDCQNLKSVIFPESVEALKSCTFQGCTSLEKVIINNPDCKLDENWLGFEELSFTIYGFEDSTAQKFAQEYGFDFVSFENPNTWLYTGLGGLYYGDINDDCKTGIADAVIMQNYILGKTELSEYELDSADINRDGYVNIFDFISLREYIIENEGENWINASEAVSCDLSVGEKLVFTPDYLSPDEYFGIGVSSNGGIAHGEETDGKDIVKFLCIKHDDGFQAETLRTGTFTVYFYKNVRNPDSDVDRNTSIIILDSPLSEVNADLANKIKINVLPVTKKFFCPKSNTLLSDSEEFNWSVVSGSDIIELYDKDSKAVGIKGFAVGRAEIKCKYSYTVTNYLYGTSENHKMTIRYSVYVENGKISVYEIADSIIDDITYEKVNPSTVFYADIPSTSKNLNWSVVSGSDVINITPYSFGFGSVKQQGVKIEGKRAGTAVIRLEYDAKFINTSIDYQVTVTDTEIIVDELSSDTHSTLPEIPDENSEIQTSFKGYVPVGALTTQYTWSIVSGSDVVSLSPVNSSYPTVHITGKKSGNAVISCTCTYKDSSGYHTKTNTYSVIVSSSYITVI